MGEWAGLGYYARARNLLKCARAVVADHGGQFPETREGLLTLPGIGPYTASAIAAIAFDQPATVVDGNVERVMARMFSVLTPLPAAKPELTALAESLTPQARPGDYAQAVMDLGATICTPRSPACGICPWVHSCTGARPKASRPSFPASCPRPKSPCAGGRCGWVTRTARFCWSGGRTGAFWAGCWAFRAMAGTARAARPRPRPTWQEVGEVRHTFTHFHLILRVLVAPVTGPAARGHWLPRTAFRPADLPTVMRKAWDLARDSLPHDQAKLNFREFDRL